MLSETGSAFQIWPLTSLTHKWHVPGFSFVFIKVLPHVTVCLSVAYVVSSYCANWWSLWLNNSAAHTSSTTVITNVLHRNRATNPLAKLHSGVQVTGLTPRPSATKNSSTALTSPLSSIWFVLLLYASVVREMVLNVSLKVAFIKQKI